MTNVLTLTPGTFLQSSFDKVGNGRKYEEVELKTTGTKKTFTAETPIQLHPGTTISGDEKAIIQLIPYASTCLWKPQVPVFSFSGENYLFEGFTFDGLADKQNVLHGKGYHNLFGGNKASKVKIQNVKIQNSMGDGVRILDSKDVTVSENKIYGIGHDGFYCERCVDVEASGNEIYTRINSGLRSKGSRSVIFRNNTIRSTAKYKPRTGPGIQVENSRANETTSNVQIINNIIDGCQSPGIWAAGHTAPALDAATGLIIKGNTITNCGQMPVFKDKETADRLSAVAGICLDGWTEVDIQENILDGNCNGIRIGTYITTSAGSGYVVRLKNNEIKNTVAPFNKDAYAGYAIAVTVPDKFNVINEGNMFSGNLKDVFGI